MALDGAFLYVAAKEMREILVGSRVEKIAQPSKEELTITFRLRGGSRKVLFSANASSPRVHFTDIALENPKTPPMFCMLLRKHIGSGKLVAIRQNGLDRVIAFDFETVNELGDVVIVTLAAEIMGRHSNLILIGPEGRIIDAVKRVSDEVSSVRTVLPGGTYTLPPAQDKLDLLCTSDEEIMERFLSLPSIDCAKSLMQTLEGISPVLSRELIYRALKGGDIEKDRLSSYYKNRIREEISALRARLLDGTCEYIAVQDEAKKLREFTLMDLTQYGNVEKKESFDSPSALLDNFYAERDRVARMKQRSHDLLRLLINATERITRKLAVQEEELRACADRETLRMYGDLLNANLYRMEKGGREVTVENFYEESCPPVTIRLDPRLSPSQNAQKYYAEYRKAATAEDMLKDLMAKSRQELIYLDSVFDAVTRTEGESELLEIREELAEQGYIRLPKKRNRMLKAQPPMKFMSSDGFSILCGRNNKQNDQLTMKTAKNYDMWLHTQGVAGSHVIIEADGKEISDQAITEAAIIAAYHSKARESAQVAVDYTRIKFVKKPAGAKPGMVIFTDYQTAFVTPDEELVHRLQVK
ncbi:NFACT family protein [Phocea massiliensis]|uniref:Rqc2 homolog RqcH n=1 Tax=Merdimmobilis hominis TaxID=2897707 RepID=A0A938X746_9FIRM|nr:NFACT RNA binding domain-containing protein [Merdimmobilis hominis]MBM6921421.1 NFACT family protein [Merdimmobilis hominis]